MNTNLESINVDRPDIITTEIDAIEKFSRSA